MLEWIQGWGGWVVILSVVMFVGSLWGGSWLLIKIPSDYFVVGAHQMPQPRTIPQAIFFVVRNLVGAVLILAGVAMLVLPGQGVITILLGMSLMHFRGKREAIRWILQRKSLRRTINWIRRRANAPPLIFEKRLTFDPQVNNASSEQSSSRPEH